MGWECDGKGGRDTECTGRLAGQNAAAGSTAAQGSGQARGMLCTIFWNVPPSSAGRLEPSPAVQHKNLLGAALFSIKLNRDGLSPPQSRHDQSFSRGIKIDLKSRNLPSWAGLPHVLWERFINGSSSCLGQH